jgi:hypothetical protein
MLPDHGKSAAYLKFARFQPLVQELHYSEDEYGQWLNDTDRRKVEVLGRKPVPVPFRSQKSHTEWSEREPGLSGD